MLCNDSRPCSTCTVFEVVLIIYTNYSCFLDVITHIESVVTRLVKLVQSAFCTQFSVIHKRSTDGESCVSGARCVYLLALCHHGCSVAVTAALLLSLLQYCCHCCSVATASLLLSLLQCWCHCYSVGVTARVAVTAAVLRSLLQRCGHCW